MGRLHPNPELIGIEERVKAWAASLPAGSRVLDAGAGDMRYRSIFGTHDYRSADFAQVEGKEYGAIDYVCDLRRIPVPAGSFDAVLCTQVLAHLPEPKEALTEMRRVLRPGGQILLTCPFTFEENERPHDYYRYTRYGLQYLLVQAGFEVVTLEPVRGYLSLLQYQLGKAAIGLPLRPSAYGGGFAGWVAASTSLLLKPTFAALCLLYTWLELRAKSRVRGMNVNWAVVAKSLPPTT